MNAYLGLQQDVMASLQYVLGPIMPFFVFLNYFDTEFFYLPFITVSWFLFGRRKGLQLSLLILFSGYINTVMKSYYQLPRPFVVDPELLVIHVSGYAFPSGAAQVAMILALFFSYNFDTKKYRWIPSLAVTYAFLIGLSRIVLGVHYFSDVIVGYLMGAVLYSLFIDLYEPIALHTAKKNLQSKLVISWAVSLLLLVIAYSLPVLLFMLLIATVLSGYALAHDHKLYHPETFLIRITKAFVALFVMVLMMVFALPLLKPILGEYATVGILSVILGTVISYGIDACYYPNQGV